MHQVWYSQNKPKCMYLIQYYVKVNIYDGANKFICYNNPMLLVLENSDSPLIVEQLSQGPSFMYNTFISDMFLALDLSYALCLVPSFLQHG